MRRRDLAPANDRFVADGKIHRCNVISKGETGIGDGAYCLYADESIPAGWFVNWTDGGGVTRWCSEPGRPLTAAERQENSRQFRANRAERDRQIATARADASRKAKRLWNAAAKVRRHPYSDRKAIEPQELRAYESALLVPIRDQKDKLVGLQFIGPNGDKRFLKGSCLKGCHYWVAHPEENRDGNTIVICEGWATGETVFQATKHAVLIAFCAWNLKAAARWAKNRYPGYEIVIAADDDWKTDGNPGLTNAAQAARAVNGRVAIPKFSDGRTKSDTDFNDMMLAKDLAAVKRAIGAAVLCENVSAGSLEAGDRDAELARLARLDAISYDQQREDAARAIGVRVSVLDYEVTARREPTGSAASRVAIVTDHEPWPEEVDGDELLHQLVELFKRHVTISEAAAVACALWVIHAHAHDAATHSPNLVISSPTKRCGKTTTLRLLRLLVPKPVASTNLTPAVVYRVISAETPTLLIDEGDTFIRNDNPDLRGILNSGHERTFAYVVRLVGDGHVPTRFSTWAPKVIALIGRMDPTLEDRSIKVELTRQLPGERAQRLPHDNDAYSEVAQKCARWAQDHIDALRGGDPQLPNLHDRALDNWRPLLAIAEVCGNDWAIRARKAAAKISAVDDDETHGIVLLRDIKGLFDRADGNNLASAKIVSDLAALENRPWPEFNRGQPLTTSGLARLLKPFKIFPRQVKVRGRPTQGYRREQFEQVFARYVSLAAPTPLPPDSPELTRG
jgi:putative DNA primase/helicase